MLRTKKIALACVLAILAFLTGFERDMLEVSWANVRGDAGSKVATPSKGSSVGAVLPKKPAIPTPANPGANVQPAPQPSAPTVNNLPAAGDSLTKAFGSIVPPVPAGSVAAVPNFAAQVPAKNTPPPPAPAVSGGNSDSGEEIGDDEEVDDGADDDLSDADSADDSEEDNSVEESDSADDAEQTADAGDDAVEPAVVVHPQ